MLTNDKILEALERRRQPVAWTVRAAATAYLQPAPRRYADHTYRINRHSYVGKVHCECESEARIRFRDYLISTGLADVEILESAPVYTD